jgi:uncharacterized protein (DUF1684 family)
MKIGSYKIKTKNLIVAGIMVSVGFIMISVILNSVQDRYTKDIQNYREDRDEYFKRSEDSPIEDQVSFRELNYFEPNKLYRVKPAIELITDSSYVTMVNNDGEKNKYWRYALAVFTIEKHTDTLTIFRKASLKQEDNHYFLPFFDETNGEETYSGGRYLDLEIEDINLLVLDFNLAYNPYCVYNYRFSCPIPPMENRLSTRIEAGERMFRK